MIPDAPPIYSEFVETVPSAQNSQQPHSTQTRTSLIPLQPRHPPPLLLDPYFLRSRLESHLRTSWFSFLPAVADSFVDLIPAKACMPVSVYPCAVFLVDAMAATERRKIVTKHKPNATHSQITRSSQKIFRQQYEDSTHAKIVFTNNVFGAVVETFLHDWSVDLECFNEFTNSDCEFDSVGFAHLGVGTDEFIIPVTEVIEKCGKCIGDAYIPCKECRGVGKNWCLACDGDGVVLSTKGDEAVVRLLVFGNGIGKKKIESVVKPNVSCSDCKGTGKRKCSACQGIGRCVCHECNGAGSVIAYLCLIVTRSLHKTSQYFLKSASETSGVFETTSCERPRYLNKIHTTLVWQDSEFSQVDESNESGPRRMVIPDVDTAIVQVDDVIDAAIPERVACGEISVISESEAERVLARRVRIRQGVIYKVNCTYKSAEGVEGTFTVVVGESDRGFFSPETPKKWVILDVEGYPVISQRGWNVCWTVGSLVVAVLAIGIVAYTRR